MNRDTESRHVATFDQVESRHAVAFYQVGKIHAEI